MMVRATLVFVFGIVGARADLIEDLAQRLDKLEAENRALREELAATRDTQVCLCTRAGANPPGDVCGSS